MPPAHPVCGNAYAAKKITLNFVKIAVMPEYRGIRGSDPIG